jgi:hypothetical protein
MLGIVSFILGIFAMLLWIFVGFAFWALVFGILALSSPERRRWRAAWAGKAGVVLGASYLGLYIAYKLGLWVPP